jgi:hypothetical protein
VTSTTRKRAALLGLAALALGACDLGLTITPDPVGPGASVTVSNKVDGPHCIVEEESDGTPVDVVGITNFVELIESGELDVVASTTTDEDGLFEVTVEAPDIPGEHLVLAVCNGIPDVDQLQAVAVDDPVDEDGVIVDTLRVTQPPLSVGVDEDEVHPGDEVVATFSRCQDENDLGFFDELEPVAVDTDDPALDFPDLDVYVDGELVETIAGEERYPTEAVQVPITLDELGDHEISGICTYQTFDIDLEWIFEQMPEEGPFPQALLPGSLGTAAIDYPLVEGPFTLDEATTEAAVTVAVVAEAVAPADVPAAAPSPAVAAPTYAG